MKTNQSTIKQTGVIIAVGFLAISASMMIQRMTVAIKNAIGDSGKIRPTADRCDESRNANEPHFTGCSSIL